MKRVIRSEHVARIEGHAGFTVELAGSSVEAVHFDVTEGPRLFEVLLKGRRFDEVAPIVARICAICSAAHTVTSLRATEAAFGVEVSAQTTRLRELLLRGESIESHSLHLFLLALPDCLGYENAIAMGADHPEEVTLGLRLKKLGNEIQEVVGGRAVHPVNLLLGGIGRVPSSDQLVKLRHELQWALDACPRILEITELLALPDCGLEEKMFASLDLAPEYDYGRGDRIRIIGDGASELLAVEDYQSLVEEAAVSRSTAKHSSHLGHPFMVGALPRLLVNRSRLSPLALACLDGLHLPPSSCNPLNNNLAQSIELISDIEKGLAEVDRLLETGLTSERPAPVHPRPGAGTAASEAPRGLLIHSYRYEEQGKLEAADVVTPTALNCLSIEHQIGALVPGLSAETDEVIQKKIEMLVRSYDPCISCSVHLVRC
jgi:coenzyme F420-reducing hydrogenase alpha subunit